MSPITASVVLSTYNQPDWLEKALWGYAAQTRLDFELLVADDGSRQETALRIDALRPMLPFALRHVWHPDQGFRKCTILNRALEQARAPYLIFSDGDCIPRRDFVAAHLAARRERRFLSGGYCKLPLATSRAITREHIAEGRATDPRWLVDHGVPRSHKLWKLAARGRLAAWLNALTPARPTWNGHNASGWRRDLEAVNGFDERMQYGGEDRELGERLEHAGVHGLGLRYSAVVVHLEHDRSYVQPEMLVRNQAIRAETRRTRAMWTRYGLRHDAAA